MAASDLIIGLGHRKRVGKDTFGDMLGIELSERGYLISHLSFAAAMKAVAADLFDGLRDAHHYEVNPEHREQVLPKIGKTPRQIWIEFGNAIREIYPDVWLDRVYSAIKVAALRCSVNGGSPRAFIITDVRYPNEVEAIKSWGGVLVKVSRKSIPHTDDIADSALAGFDGWDHFIGNHGDIADLEDIAFHFASTLTNKGKA